MSNPEEVKTTCDWCLQAALVQTIDEKLWRFWKIISSEDPSMTSHKNICDKCKSRYERYSIYIERCKINTFKIDELLSMVQVKDEPSVDIEYPPLIKRETSNEVDSNSYGPAVSSGVFIERRMAAGCSNSRTKSNNYRIKGPLIHIEDDLMNEEDVWKQEASDPDYPTALDHKGKVGLILRVVLERQVLPDSMVNQKKVNNNHTCTYCGKTLNSSHTLRNHLRTHTSDTTFKCSTCNKSFTRLSNLNRHLLTHTGEKPFKCSDCNKSFAEMSILKHHLLTHTGEKPFKCSHCNKSFTQSNHLNDHLRTHTGEKPFKCSHCNQSFTRLSNLNVHLRTHTGEKPYKCSDCNKSFPELSSLKRHLLTHTGEKPFKCSHCNKSFTQLGHLNDHLRTHTGDKPFKCSHCNKSFTQSSHLNDHLRTHTGDKSFKCSHCNKRFVHSRSLRRHSLFHTNDK